MIVRRLMPDMRRATAVELFRELTANFTPEHVAFLIEHDTVLPDLVPEFLRLPLTTYLMKHMSVMLLSENDMVEVACEARPDLAPLLVTEDGRKWTIRCFKPDM